LKVYHGARAKSSIFLDSAKKNKLTTVLALGEHLW